MGCAASIAASDAEARPPPVSPGSPAAAPTALESLAQLLAAAASSGPDGPSLQAAVDAVMDQVVDEAGQEAAGAGERAAERLLGPQIAAALQAFTEATDVGSRDILPEAAAALAVKLAAAFGAAASPLDRTLDSLRQRFGDASIRWGGEGK